MQSESCENILTVRHKSAMAINERSLCIQLGNKYKSNTARIVIYLRKLLLRTIVSLNHRMPLVLLIPFKPFSGAGLPCSRFGF